VTNEAGCIVIKTNCVSSSTRSLPLHLICENVQSFKRWSCGFLHCTVYWVFFFFFFFFLFHFGGDWCLLCQGYFQLIDHPLNNICRENLQTYIWISLLPTDIRYMYIWNSRVYTFAIRHKIDIVNRKTIKAACVSVTAQNRNFFFFILSSAVKKYCGLLCFTFCMQSGTWNSGCGLRLFQVQW